MIEGSTELVTARGANRGPAAKNDEGAFYNAAMRVNRDLSVATVAAFAATRGRSIDVADVLAGTGARSLRLAHELDADVVVHANDADPRAVAAIQEGRARNGIDPARLEVTHGDAHRFLATRRFDVVDVDPFGAPTPFLDAAVRATRHGGLLCLTATDTAALCGTYPRVCRRRYGAEHRLHRMPWRAEVGLRILAATAIKAAGRFDRAATPLWSCFGGHWMRVVLRMEDGRQKADGLAKRLGRIAATPGDLGTFADEGSGPAWTGPLHDAAFVAAMADASLPEDSARLVARFREEADAAPFWADPGCLHRAFGRDPPKRDALMTRLRDAGFHAARTHLDDQGIRTDAGLDDLRGLW